MQSVNFSKDCKLLKFKQYYLYDGVSLDLFIISKRLYIYLSILVAGKSKRVPCIIKNEFKHLCNEICEKRQKRKINNTNSNIINKKNIILAISNRCNMNCSYCFKNNEEQHNMNIRIAEDTISYIMKNFKKNEIVCTYNITSEPLLELKQLKEFIEFFKQFEYYSIEKEDLKNIGPCDFLRTVQQDSHLPVDEKITEEEALLKLNQLLSWNGLICAIDKSERARFTVDHLSKSTFCLIDYRQRRLNYAYLQEIYKQEGYLREKCLRYCSLWFMSNGSILNEDIIKIIKGNFMNPFTISLDGNEDQNVLRKFKNGGESYSIVLKNIKLLQEAGIDVKISCVMSLKNHDILSLVKFFQSLNVKQINLTVIRRGTDWSFDEKTICSLLKDYDVLYDLFYRSILNWDFSFVSLFSSDHCLDPLRALLTGSIVKYRCDLNNQLVVDFKGDLYPCTYLVGKDVFLLGNIYKSDECITDKAISVDERKDCNDCWARYLCGGTCYYNSWKIKGSFENVDPVECVLRKYYVHKSIELYLRLIEAGLKYEQIIKIFL